ncbi:hypothetical protein HPB50_011280 [Hyalomma asiaticum]|uniref:Uncharacterized protein n=1 Tax=Hyalomma asiaticum TaxID=266040 RepID=A0ACB7TET3_HYAAI|nr:hypothetical protein HPB50_011280 [Hyalomma asiaticum]
MKFIEKCEKCKAAVLGSSDSEHAYLTVLKEYVQDGANLHYPSAEVMSLLKACEEHFKGIVAWTDNLVSMKSPVQAIITYLNKMLRCDLRTCDEHKEAVWKLLISSYTRMRLRIHLRQLEVRHANGNASKTCAGANLT